MPARFVILHHTGCGGEHWDFMIERDGVLLTWQLLAQPTDPGALPIVAKRIGDHRLAYLDYEGPVSGDRGQVRRVDAGTAEFEDFTASYCAVILRGERISGRFALAAAGDGAWTLDRAPPEE